MFISMRHNQGNKRGREAVPGKSVLLPSITFKEIWPSSCIICIPLRESEKALDDPEVTGTIFQASCPGTSPRATSGRPFTWAGSIRGTLDPLLLMIVAQDRPSADTGERCVNRRVMVPTSAR